MAPWNSLFLFTMGWRAEKRRQHKSYWIEEYCLVGNKDCVRYQLEEKGEYHPDNMLPDGEIREKLWTST
jgi:hypothetical protein